MKKTDEIQCYFWNIQFIVQGCRWFQGAEMRAEAIAVQPPDQFHELPFSTAVAQTVNEVKYVDWVC